MQNNNATLVVCPTVSNYATRVTPPPPPSVNLEKGGLAIGNLQFAMGKNASFNPVYVFSSFLIFRAFVIKLYLEKNATYYLHTYR